MFLKKRYYKLLMICFFSVLLIMFIRNLNDVGNWKNLKRNWHDYNAILKALQRVGPGEAGRPVLLNGYRNGSRYGYKLELSDRISVNRSVHDTRHTDKSKYVELCKNVFAQKSHEISRYCFVFCIIEFDCALGDYRLTNAMLKRDWHDYEAIKIALARTGPGEVGSAVLFDEYQKGLYKEYGYNAILADQISVNRSVPDIRPADCKNFTQLAQLPKAAIIIIFFNERLSVLLRTVYGIINRSPDELIQEIILVDDCSTYSQLHETLTDYLRINLPTERSKVRLIRLTARSGLMKARMTGARAASKESKILIFMDAHFEVNYNWLPPLLEPIALNPKTCTCPGLDYISFADFKYEKNEPFRGYFDWQLNYVFISVEPHEEKEPAKNYREYIIMGAAIAIDANFFWNLGGFDEGMILWGGEQFELSFKIWMCGGEIYQVPCSRMAHLFRDPDTKGNTNLYGSFDFVENNYRRFIDVWIDEKHRQYIFNRRPSLKEANPGDLSERFAIRDRLKCKSFSWMMENIMTRIKEVYPPIEPDDLATGFLKSIHSPNLCVALYNTTKVVLQPCPASDAYEENKYWTYTWRGHIRTDNSRCLECDSWNKRVNSWPCHELGGVQKWYYDREKKWVAHVENKMCMVANITERLVQLATCDSSNLAMKWTITQMNQTEMKKWETKLGWSSKRLK